MSLLDTASLLLTPNAYKEGKLYSVIPSDGSGDFTFTRATTATRVNSDGLVELVPYNLLQYSQQIENAAWVKAGVGGGLAPVVTANAGTAPDGTLTADRVQFDCVSNLLSTFRSRINQSVTGIVGNSYSGSFYIKAFSPSEVGKQLRYVVENAGISNVITITADWQRIELSGTATTTSFSYLLETRGTFTTNTTADVLLWGAQLVEGTNALPYQKTETRLNIPRLDYSLGGCPSILLEPQRTNTLTYSDQFDNAAWVKSNVTITPNTIASPSGVSSADTFTDNTTNGAHAIVRFSQWSTTQQTFSIYVKPNTLTKFYIANGSLGSSVFFDLTTLTIEGTITAFSSPMINNTITPLPNGWYRLSTTHTATASQTIQFGSYKIFNASSLGASATYVGTGETAYLWGAQLEAGAYATSYIPTTTASVTRNNEIARKTGISSLIGQSSGAFMIDGKLTYGSTANTTYFSISDGTNNNQLRIVRGSSANSIRVIFQLNGGVLQFDINNLIIDFNVNHKIGVIYSSGFIRVSIDGATVASSTNALTLSAPLSVVGLCNPLGVFDHTEPLRFNKIVIINQLITESELNQLTTI